MSAKIDSVYFEYNNNNNNNLDISVIYYITFHIILHSAMSHFNSVK